MTIGEGIFWSTVVVVSFIALVLVTKHRLWKKILRLFLVIVAICVVGAAGLKLYSSFKNRPQVMHSLHGIELGMSEVEVTLLKGEPDQTWGGDETAEGSTKTLRFDDGLGSKTYVILRVQAGSREVTNICDQGGRSKVLGLGRYDSEQDVFSRLGDPASTSIDSQGTKKFVSYPQWNAAFEIARGNVTMVCVTDRPKMGYSEEYEETPVEN